MFQPVLRVLVGFFGYDRFHCNMTWRDFPCCENKATAKKPSKVQSELVLKLRISWNFSIETATWTKIIHQVTVCPRTSVSNLISTSRWRAHGWRQVPRIEKVSQRDRDLGGFIFILVDTVQFIEAFFKKVLSQTVPSWSDARPRWGSHWFTGFLACKWENAWVRSAEWRRDWCISSGWLAAVKTKGFKLTWWLTY